jgi:hypothetical protein
MKRKEKENSSVNKNEAEQPVIEQH